MKRVAILLDGGFVLKRLFRLLDNRHPSAEEVIGFAKACVLEDEEIFRIYYYDCPPYSGTRRKPLVEGVTTDFGQTTTARRCRSLHDKLARMELVAFRRGVLGFRGWGLTPESEHRLQGADASATVAAEDLQPKFEQKQVDMKIGLDVAWLASKQIVDRVVLVTADQDFVPAMKFARREGTQVVLVTMRSEHAHSQLFEHADYVRTVPVCGESQ